MKQKFNSEKNSFVRLKSWGFCFLMTLAITLSSCSSHKNLENTYYRELARASIKLGIDIEKNDNYKLMIESARWLGTPYRYGGTSFNGIDCSGLSCNIYRNVYNIKLSRNSQAQLDNDVDTKVKKGKLKQGDLVFFSNKRSRKRINHVGIYLKEGKFIHASSSKGVRMDYLDNSYWAERWITGGRINRANK